MLHSMRICNNCMYIPALPGLPMCRECNHNLGDSAANISTVSTPQQYHIWEMENDGLRPAGSGNLMSRYKALLKHCQLIGGFKERWQAQQHAQARLADEPNIGLVAADEEAEHNLRLSDLSEEAQEQILEQAGGDTESLAFWYRLTIRYRMLVIRLFRCDAVAHARELYYTERGFLEVAAREEEEYKQGFR